MFSAIRFWGFGYTRLNYPWDWKPKNEQIRDCLHSSITENQLS